MVGDGVNNAVNASPSNDSAYRPRPPHRAP
jgi:hypothetical protein